MILIADSGSTKTDWRLVDDKKNIHQYSTIGFNPFFLSTEEISKEIKTSLLSFLSISPLSVSNIYFYGAGCSSETLCKEVYKALKICFQNATIEVHHDLLGAARASCGNKEGMAAILGTGSNSCFYNGSDITENITALGYILGDEGSGAHIGKTFIQAYLNKELPKIISDRFFERYKLDKEAILDAVYKKPLPNRFLASFSKFIFQNVKEEPYLSDMVLMCFDQFFDKHICKYKRHKEVDLNCVGSVAFYFSPFLKNIAEKRGISLGTILETPIAGLTLYHLEDKG